MENRTELAEVSPPIYPIGKGCERCETTGLYRQYSKDGLPTGREEPVQAGSKFPGPCNTTWNWIGVYVCY